MCALSCAHERRKKEEKKEGLGKERKNLPLLLKGTCARAIEQEERRSSLMHSPLLLHSGGEKGERKKKERNSGESEDRRRKREHLSLIFFPLKNIFFSKNSLKILKILKKSQFILYKKFIFLINQCH